MRPLPNHFGYLLSVGYAVGPLPYDGGSGSDFLCIPGVPEWNAAGNQYDDSGSDRAELAGVSYGLNMSLFSTQNNGGVSLSE